MSARALRYATIVADPPWHYDGFGVNRAPQQWFIWPRQGQGNHSRKPDAFYDLVESVSPGPYLEMFSRRSRLGWSTWGDEALHGTELVA